MSSKPRFVGEKVKLGDVATYVNGYAFKPSDYSDSGLPIVRIQNLTGNAYRTNRYEGTLPEKFAIQDGDILISWSASLGVFEWNQGSAWLNQHIFRVVFNKAMIDKRFFVHQARFLIQKSQSLAHGATMKHLTKKVFETLPFLYLGLNNQKMIAEQLDALDTQINRAKRQIRFLDNLAKSRFVEMFGVYEPDCTIDEACVVLSGFAFKSTRYVDDGIRIIRIANVQKGYIEDKTPCYYPETDQNAAANYALREDDLLVSLTGNVGRVGLMTKEMLPAALNQRVACLRPKSSNKLNTRYLFALLNLDEFEKAAIEASSGSAQKNLSIKWLKSHCIAIPPSEIQSAFSAFCNQVDKSRFS